MRTDIANGGRNEEPGEAAREISETVRPVAHPALSFLLYVLVCGCVVKLAYSVLLLLRGYLGLVVGLVRNLSSSVR